jgi:FixJ family two-component response regulator/tetratricopeptide (TPR) repeat protein
MKKSRINILIVEDDVTQGKALFEAFSRDGYSAHLCTTSVQAITLAQRQEFQCLMVDCMLPKMNGVDLVTEILAMIPNKPKVFLFTGIFKDREFTREAMKKTGADMFFMKPLDLAVLLHHVEQTFSSEQSNEAPPILRIYTSETMDDASLAKLIDQEGTLHAFHLPMLYQRIHDTDLTGELTMISADGDVSAASFYRGNVCSVRTPDKDSYFGSLAVSHGFVSPNDVLEALKNPGGALLGTKLIESMSLSPHAIDVILEEQMGLRLSQTIRDDVVSVQWIGKKLPKPQYVLDDAKFEYMIEDWLESKITAEWIKSLLMSWGAFQIEGDYHSRIRGSKPIHDVLSEDLFGEDKGHHEIFRALLRGNAFIGARAEEAPDFSFLDSRLDQMARDFKLMNYYQILGLNEKAATREVTKSFEGLQEAFDPESLPAECPPELREKCRRVFATLTKARDVLVDDVERLRYLQYLHNKRGQEMLEAEPIFRTAILEIMSDHSKEAGKKFQSLIDRKLEFKDLRAYRIWSGLKEDRNFSALRLDQVPPEERHSAAYMMARGIYHRLKGQYKKAIESFRTAHVLDPRLRMAKHELKILLHEMERQRGNRNLIREVTSIVDTMFTKTRRGA